MNRQVKLLMSSLKMFGVSQCGFLTIGLIAALLASPPAWAQELKEDCTASLLNRVSQVQPDGSFVIPNVPVVPGLVRVRITCARGGTTADAQSEFVTLTPNQMIEVRRVLFSVVTPIPASLQIQATETTLTTQGQTAQLTATATLSDDSTKDVTDQSTGTVWSASNATIASVDADGLVTAVSSGTAIISATNEGILASIAISVILGTDDDGDGLPNDFELANGLNPNDPSDAGQDFDGDGLTNLEEFNLGTDLAVADTDGDGLNDGEEVIQGTSPTNPDSDLDGLLDGAEIVQGSDPLDSDSDDDGLPDGLEVALVGNPFGANPFADNDGDGLANLDELQLFTDPTNPDTDGDGLTDGEEVLAGTDPLVPDSNSPLVSLTNPPQGAELIEGETIPITADATDDGRVTRVDFLVDGSVVGSDTTAPFAFAFEVPSGVTALTFGAEAVDTNNNVGIAPAVSVSVIPDPLTTVAGVVIDEGGFAVAGATVTTVGDLSGITLADGSFTIPEVPTILGNIIVAAAFTTTEGDVLSGTSIAVPPVLGGITDVGTIVLSSAVFEEEIGVGLGLFDDDFAFIAFTEGFTFPFFGTVQNGVFVGSNGYLTFDSGDTDFEESVGDFLGPQPRIAPFFDDLTPTSTGGDVFVNQFPDRFVVTYNNVPEFFDTGSNTFQVILFNDGRIQLGYRDLTAADAIVGVSPGGPTPPFVQVDYSGDTPFSTAGAGIAILEQFDTSPFDLEESFLIFTPNAPGGFDVTRFAPARTTAEGFVVDSDDFPVEGARVSVGSISNRFFTTTDVDGFFSIPEVFSTRGNLQARAVKITAADELLFGVSDAVLPVPGGITDLGILTAAVIELPLGTFETDIGVGLSQGDDQSTRVFLPFPFPFFGTEQTQVFVGSNGYLTFGSGDTDFSESVSEFLGPAPRIAPFFDDLDPRVVEFLDGVDIRDVFVNDQLPGRFVVTWNQVGEFSFLGSNTFQVTLVFDGRIQLAYNGLTARDAIVGISPGGSPAPPSTPVDYSGDTPLSTVGPNAIFEQFFSPTNNPFDLDGNFVIFTPNVSDGFDVIAVPLPPPPGVGTVAGYVLGSDGSPYVGVKVLVTSSSDPQFGETALTDDTGHYSVSGVPGGGINVTAIGSDGTILAREAEIYTAYEDEIYINPVPASLETKPEP